MCVCSSKLNWIKLAQRAQTRQTGIGLCAISIRRRICMPCAFVFCRRQRHIFNSMRNVITSFYAKWRTSHNKFCFFFFFFCAHLTHPNAMHSKMLWLCVRMCAIIFYTKCESDEPNGYYRDAQFSCTEFVENVKERKFSFSSDPSCSLHLSFAHSLMAFFVCLIFTCILFHYAFSHHMKWVHALSILYARQSISPLFRTKPNSDGSEHVLQ